VTDMLWRCFIGVLPCRRL